MCVLRYIVYLLPINQSTNPSNARYWTMIKCMSGVCVLGHPSVLCVSAVAAAPEFGGRNTGRERRLTGGGVRRGFYD